MVCSVCQEKVGKCESGACGEVLRDRFYCFGGVHFCSRSCWKAWFLSGEEERLTLAKGMKEITLRIETVKLEGKSTKRYPIRYGKPIVSIDPDVAERLAKHLRRKIKPIEVIGKVPKEKGVTMYDIYDMDCANCGISPEFAGKILTGGCMERGEWVCSKSCYTVFEEKRIQDNMG